MKPTRKNNFFTFIFSFCPGAAEMYMGFMKNGFSIMALFFFVCGIFAFTRFDFTVAIIALLWFYGFFHARNIAKMDDESFYNFKDIYVWEEFDINGSIKVPSDKLRIGVALIMILIGLGVIWDYVTEIIYKLIPDIMWDYIYPIVDNIPSVVLAIALIAFGIALISGKKKEIEMPQNAADVVASVDVVTTEQDTEKKEA